VESTVKVTVPRAAVSTAGTSFTPDSCAVKVAPAIFEGAVVEDVAVLEVVLDVGAIVEVVVVVVPPPHPEIMAADPITPTPAAIASATLRARVKREVFLMTAPPCVWREPLTMAGIFPVASESPGPPRCFEQGAATF
jgi:hypothetical protein